MGNNNEDLKKSFLRMAFPFKKKLDIPTPSHFSDSLNTNFLDEKHRMQNLLIRAYRLDAQLTVHVFIIFEFEVEIRLNLWPKEKKY